VAPDGLRIALPGRDRVRPFRKREGVFPKTIDNKFSNVLMRLRRKLEARISKSETISKFKIPIHKTNE